MRKPQVILGAVILIMGLAMLIGNLTGVDICAYLLPLILIGIGVWIVTRPAMFAGGRDTQIQILGDIRRRGKWTVHEQDFWCGIGDIRLDFTDAVVLAGETTLRLRGFVNDITVIVPESVGVSVASTSFLTSARIFGYKQDYFLTLYETESNNYGIATRKVRLELFYFVADLKVRKAQTEITG
jgi:lia operon protein LiaF